MSIRLLTKELQEKAIKELHEDPKRVPEDIAYIKEWLKKQPYLKARTDDQWLLTFLRGCKFSLERTKEKLDMFYTMRTLLPEFFRNRDPMRPELQKIMDLGLFLPLPNTKRPDSPRILLARTTPYDPTINVLDIVMLNMMIQDILIKEDDQLVIAGQSVIQDLKGASMNHMMEFSPSLVKKTMTCYNSAYPNRPKSGHFINIPSFFEKILVAINPFMPEKLKKRMNVHAQNYEKMYEDIPQYLLPNEYGGEAGTIAEITLYWKKKVESYKDWFLEDEKYGTDEAKRPGKAKTSDSVFGLEGSFRKLTVD